MTTTKITAKSSSAFTADTKFMCQFPWEQMPIPEPKRLSQPTHTHTCSVCVLVAAGVSTVYCPVSPISLRLFKAKDGTCSAIEKGREKKKRRAQRFREGWTGLAHSWCTMLSAWLMDTGPSCLSLCHWKVVPSDPTSSSSFSCSLANSMKTCRTGTRFQLNWIGYDRQVQQKSKLTSVSLLCFLTLNKINSFEK